MRIAVVMASLSGGGIERMRLQLIREWLRRGIEIDLVVMGFAVSRYLQRSATKKHLCHGFGLIIAGR